MITATATQVRNNFQHYVNLAAYGGHQVVVERMGKPLVVMVGTDGLRDESKESYNQEEALRRLEEFSGAGGSANGVDMKKVYSAIKENYDLNRILGRQYTNR